MAHIRDGYGAGLTALAQLFSRANKASPQRQALKAQGQTPGVSWETLKAHVKYMGARAAGAAHQPVADVMASYAEYRLWKRQYPQRMTAIKTIDPALLQVPAQAEPEKLKKTQKVGRFFTVAWFTKAQKQAKELKKQARAGQIDPELEGAVQEAMAHQDADASRRARKAIHLAKLRRFLNALDARAEQMGQLHLEARSLRAQARGQGAPALFARKKLTYMGNRLVAADAADLRATFAGIKGAKQNWEQGLAGSERAMTTELRNRYDAFFNSLRQFALKVKPQEAL